MAVVGATCIEDLIARARRLDLERLQLLHQATTKGQVVRGDQLPRFEPVREIAEEDRFRDVVIPQPSPDGETPPKQLVRRLIYEYSYGSHF